MVYHNYVFREKKISVGKYLVFNGSLGNEIIWNSCGLNIYGGFHLFQRRTLSALQMQAYMRTGLQMKAFMLTRLQMYAYMLTGLQMQVYMYMMSCRKYKT